MHAAVQRLWLVEADCTSALLRVRIQLPLYWRLVFS